MKQKKKNACCYYAVHLGHQPGVYKTWAEAKIQTDGFSGAKFKKFDNIHEAQYFARFGTRKVIDTWHHAETTIVVENEDASSSSSTATTSHDKHMASLPKEMIPIRDVPKIGASITASFSTHDCSSFTDHLATHSSSRVARSEYCEYSSAGRTAINSSILGKRKRQLCEQKDSFLKEQDKTLQIACHARDNDTQPNKRRRIQDDCYSQHRTHQQMDDSSCTLGSETKQNDDVLSQFFDNSNDALHVLYDTSSQQQQNTISNASSCMYRDCFTSLHGDSLHKKDTLRSCHQHHVDTTKTCQKDDTTNCKRTVYRIFTDGSCRGNGTVHATGGIGIYFEHDPSQNTSLSYHEIMDSVMKRHPRGDGYMDLSLPATSSRMEILALVYALEWCQMHVHQFDSSHVIHIYTDSLYAYNCHARGWIQQWKKMGWVTSRGTHVANQDLLQRFDTLVTCLMQTYPFICIKKIAGHAGYHGNEEADRLANEACQRDCLYKHVSIH